MTEPFDFNQALDLARRSALAQKGSEQAVREAAQDLAEKERTYRCALAQRIVREHAEGCAWTVAQDLARGDRAVADLRYSRDVAKGVLDAASQRGWRHTADRKDTLEFIRWSAKRDLADAYEPPTGDGRTFGRRAA